MDPTTVMHTVRAWLIEDQLDFAFRLWDQLIDSGWRPELTDDLKAVLDLRLAAYQADPTNVFTWEQVLARVRRQ